MYFITKQDIASEIIDDLIGNLVNHHDSIPNQDSITDTKFNFWSGKLL